jgi:hypothetical protein
MTVVVVIISLIVIIVLLIYVVVYVDVFGFICSLVPFLFYFNLMLLWRLLLLLPLLV